MHGSYKLIIFQLYPFVLKSFFDVKATDINDNCYDLQRSENIAHIIHPLLKNAGFEKRIKIISDALLEIFHSKKAELDLMIREAIQFILDGNTRVRCNRTVQAPTRNRKNLRTPVPGKQVSRPNNLSRYSGSSNLSDS